MGYPLPGQQEFNETNSNLLFQDSPSEANSNFVKIKVKPVVPFSV